ncbi:hypothetical protein OH76DRAFT_1409672 [Lentinus brumalis]|uniref:MYND-type domain-containing protein n=1 Tax=Lentinus brumalis TaxID=2498619 RepID=A0A371CUE1_9APHY|nr:hypothetical protein OH76DRAFT_1409672 [Polyporus brumalis]
MAFKRDAFHDAYSCGPQCRACVPQMAHFVVENPTDSVMAYAATDTQSILELAARCATGCAAPFKPEAALLFTDIVLKRHGTCRRTKRLSISDVEHNHAHAAASLACLIKYRTKDSAGTLTAYLEDTDLLHAVMDAHAAVHHGFRFPGAFEVADVVLRLGEAHGQDVRGGARFGEYTQLWDAYDARQRKMRQDPARHTCAAPTCGFRSLRARKFRRCAGSCAPEVKPGYCSKSCQRKDWAAHKAVCGSRRPKPHTTYPETLDTPGFVEEI